MNGSSGTSTMSKEQKERKARKAYSSMNYSDNEQMLQDIRIKLAAHQKDNDSRKSVTPSPVTVRENATPSPVTEINSPGSIRTKPRPSPVDFDRQRHHHEQMAKIRDKLKPHHRSDTGFNYPIDNVNQEMLQELILKGYDQNSSVAALFYCNSSSVDDAIDYLTSHKSFSSAQEASSKSLFSGQGTDRGINIDDIIPDDAYDFEATFPGHSLPKSKTKAKPYPPTLITRDLSPIHSSPDHSPHNTPPPEANRHVHVSPPPDVQPRTYSPFSAPFSRQSQTPPVYDKNARLPHGYSPMLRPSSELSDSGIEEETTSQRNPVPPEAFKFYMEQHIENILKAYQQRQQRRMKLEVEMGKRNLDEATCEQMRKLLAQKESNFLRMKRAKMHRDQFDIVKPIGVGAFGVVSLVRKKDTRRLYAMKSLRKADVVRRNQVAHVKAERDILAEADNEWVVKLYYSFQDAECLYFVMEYIPGGDMMSLLIKLGTFPEHLTLFYIAELVCAIESVHKMGFIHRDIKPDNILIEADGHIKLTDFGLCTGFRWTHDSKRYQPKGSVTSGHNRQASIEPDTSGWGVGGVDQCTCPMKPLEIRRLKEHHRCVAHSLVGTPNYIAPEILRRVGYTQLCDWWSVGVIMYEMLVGQPPFMAPTPAETQLKIMNWPEYLRVPHHAQLSPVARDLVIRFLSDPQDRIGRNGAEEIKCHPFFTSRIEWDVGIRNYVAPYKPKIMYEGDTSNFDPIPQSQLQKIHKQHPTSSMPKDHPEPYAFYEFTFIRFAASDKASDSKRPTIAPSNGSNSSHSNHDKVSSTPANSSGNSSQRDHVKESRKDKKRSNPQPVYV